MKIVEISATLGNELKRYNVFTEVSTSKQPFTTKKSVLYGVTKPTDIIQTNEPTNILVDEEGNPIDDSEDVYFGIRVYPYISMRQDISCNNNTISYGEVYGFGSEGYFPNTAFFNRRALLFDPYTGELYPEPEFVPGSPDTWPTKENYRQAMQQFVNDCVFPTKPNLDIPGQSLSADYGYGNNNISYFNPEIAVLPKLNQRAPRGVLSLIDDEDKWNTYQYYMAQFDGQKLNFKFGMAVNSDFASDFTEPNIHLPYLYRTYGALGAGKNSAMGVIMQCLLYDSNGNVISA